MELIFPASVPLSTWQLIKCLSITSETVHDTSRGNSIREDHPKDLLLEVSSSFYHVAGTTTHPCSQACYYKTPPFLLPPLANVQTVTRSGNLLCKRSSPLCPILFAFRSCHLPLGSLGHRHCSMTKENSRLELSINFGHLMPP